MESAGRPPTGGPRPSRPEPEVPEGAIITTRIVVMEYLTEDGDEIQNYIAVDGEGRELGVKSTLGSVELFKDTILEMTRDAQEDEA